MRMLGNLDRASAMEAAAGFEPAIRALQARALPLGYAAIRPREECSPKLDFWAEEKLGVLERLLGVTAPGAPRQFRLGG